MRKKVGRVVGAMVMAAGMLLVGGGGVLEARVKTHACERNVDQVLVKVIAEVEKKFGLQCIGNGGRRDEQLKHVRMAFASHKARAVDEAREVMVKVVQRFVTAINGDESLKAHLEENSFTAEQVEVSILFKQKKGEKNPVALVSHFGGVIRYKTIDDVTNKFVLVQKETYTDAVSILEPKPKEPVQSTDVVEASPSELPANG